MKTLPWIVAALGTGVAAYFWMNQQGMQHATGSERLEGAARRTTAWGSRQRIKGLGGNLLGKMKQGLGRVTDTGSLEREGLADRAAGSVEDALGATAQAAGRMLHDFNS
jgi:uncharacterized protein YjbJ (UPF0337 family)